MSLFPNGSKPVINICRGLRSDISQTNCLLIMSLREKYISAQVARRSLERYPNARDPQYKAAHAAVLDEIFQLINFVHREGIFSSNEEKDDIQTSDIKLLSLNFQLGELLDSSPVDVGESSVQSRARTLQQACRAYLNFLSLIIDYKIITFEPLLKFVSQCLPNRHGQFDLSSAVSENATVARQTKINVYSFERSSRQEAGDLEFTEPSGTRDNEEEVRAKAFAILQYQAALAWQNISSNALELKLLSNVIGKDTLKEDPSLDTGPGVPMSEIGRKAAVEQDHSTRVESTEGPGSRSGPAIGPGGKVLRPFTLTRDKLQSQVLGYGQEAPTMTVEEFVEHELKNGGMAKPQAEEPEIDEDDPNHWDAETERQRRWDDFTEANPKGSGNTMNLG